MKALVFDSGPVISLTMNNLLWLLEALREKFDGKFYITNSVREELIEKPFKIKRFEFEAIQVSKILKEGTLRVYQNQPKKSKALLDLANQCYSLQDKPLTIIHQAETEILALACELGSVTAVVDERTIRLLLEDPESLRTLLERRLHKDVTMNKKKVKEFQAALCNVGIIRSAELAAVAFSKGLLDEFIPQTKKGKETLLDAVLWGLKTNGCAITSSEINEMKKILLK